MQLRLGAGGHRVWSLSLVWVVGWFFAFFSLKSLFQVANRLGWFQVFEG